MSASSLLPVGSEKLISIENICYDEPEETLMERLAGLKEMFLDEFGGFGKFLCSSFGSLCNASWVVFTTVAILGGPVIYETERQRIDEAPVTSKEAFDDLPSQFIKSQ